MIVAVAAALASVAPGAAAASSDGGDRSLQARYDAARDEYEIGHYQAAFAMFAVLADAGHCASARIALQMVQHGRALYATTFVAPPERIEGWRRLDACQAVAPSPR